jgi:Mg2+/Co2+ transporter CorC
MNSDEENDIMLETEDVVDATDMIDDGEGEVVEKEEKDEEERRYIDEEEDNILPIQGGANGQRWRVKALTEIAQLNEEIGTN